MTAERIHAPQFQLYKESTIPWAPVIPNHWETKRAKSLFKKMERPVRESDEVVTCFRDGTVTLRRNRRESGFTESLKEIGYQGIRPGDLVIHAMDAFAGAIGVSDSAGKGTPVYSVCTPIGEANPLYYAHALREMSRNKWIESLAKGIRERSSDFRFTEFSAQVVPVPPPEEQTAIVRYLDDADQRIRAYVSVKERLIALLEEERQAVIHQAVTQGLDPNVKLKPSGVEWLGGVPEHWGIQRLKTVCGMKSGEGITAMSIENEGEYPVYGGNGLRGYTSEFTHDGDYLLIGRQGALCGNVHIARGQFWASEHAVVTTVYTDHILEWLSALLEVMNLNQYSIAAAQPGLAVERVMNLWVPVPPHEEQENIAASIGKQTKGIDNTGDQAHRQINLMNEYRTRLIADVVTGQLDVREAAEELPTPEPTEITD